MWILVGKEYYNRLTLFFIAFNNQYAQVKNCDPSTALTTLKSFNIVHVLYSYLQGFGTDKIMTSLVINNRTVYWNVDVVRSIDLERLVAKARKGHDSRLFVLTRYVFWNLLRRVPLRPELKEGQERCGPEPHFPGEGGRSKPSVLCDQPALSSLKMLFKINCLRIRQLPILCF